MPINKFDPFGYAGLPITSDYWNKEPIPPMEEVVTPVMPEGGYKGVADPGFIDYLLGGLETYGAPTSIFPGALGKSIAEHALSSAQQRRQLDEALGGIPESYASYAYGAPALPAPMDEITKYKMKMNAPTAIPEGKPAMYMQGEPVNLQAPPPATPGIVRAYDPTTGKSYDYSGGKSEVTLSPQGNAAGPGFQAPEWVNQNPADRYKPSAMEPGSSAFAEFGGPSPGEERAQKYAAGQTEIAGEQAKVAQQQYLLEQAKQFGPSVLTGKPIEFKSPIVEAMEGLIALRTARKQPLIPEATKAAKETYEKANPGKSFESLSDIDKRDSIEAVIDRMLESGDYGKAEKTVLAGIGLR